MVTRNLVIVETQGHGTFKRVALVASDGFELYAGNGRTLKGALEALETIAGAELATASVLWMIETEVTQ